ncbi:MAG: DNA polymerase III subunit delta, partial [Tannerella sp.]|nr:DNA polymerase III subunit delta [Tannerella sp.]
MFFRDIIGQENLKQQLIASTRTGIVAHSQLFCGQAGFGVFPIAFAYARYLNCTDRTDTDSCGKCPSCLKYNVIAHPDLHFIFPMAQEGKKTVCDDYLTEWRSFLSTRIYFDLNMWLNEIDTTKQAIIYAKESDEIMRKVSLKIYEADYRILFIWMPERMHQTCANKLLKVIEEPPPFTTILMVSEEPDKILGTIQSRSQRINVKPIELNALAQIVSSLYSHNDESSMQIARMAHGDYIQMIENLHVSEDNEFFLQQFINIMRNAWARDVKKMKSFAEEMASLKKEQQKMFLVYCQRLIRENFIYRFQLPELNYMNREESAFSAKFSPYITESNVMDFIEELSDAERQIGQNVNVKMVFYDLSLRV